MRLIIAKDYADVSRKAANIIAAQIYLKPDCVLGLATGSSPVGTYKELIAKYESGDLDYIMLMGRVMSGKGGDTILRVCNEILADEYPQLAAKCLVTLPDEKMRRVGQSVAAASLPKVTK